MDEDRALYLRLLASSPRNTGVHVLAYCLMTNHIYLVAMRVREDSLNLVVGESPFPVHAVHQPAPWPQRASLAEAVPLLPDG